MAYSTTSVFTWTADNIIERALRIIGEYDEGDAPTSGEETTALLALNSMVREWAVTDGIGLWLRRRCILILNPDQWRYTLGAAGTTTPYTAVSLTDNFHAFYDTELNEGTGTAIEPATETTIAVDAWIDYAGNTGSTPADGDYVGVELDDGTIFWDTVAAGSSSTTVVLDNGVPAGSATRVGSKVFTYTNRIPRPHGILTVSRESNDKSSATVSLIGRKEYEMLSKKDSSGVPTQVHFDPQLDTHLNPAATLHVWPVSNDTSWWKLTFVGEFQAAANTDVTENIEFPDEWASCLAWNLANELADEYEIALPRIARIQSMAERKFTNLAWAADREEASFHMALDRSGR